MRALGIDIGSRSIEVLLLEDGIVLEYRKTDTGFSPMDSVSSLLEGLEYDAAMATGYGRQFLESKMGCSTITEIKAYATAARYLYPEAMAVLDIGGQDCKAISLMPDGRMKKFEMNDRCAAGTGRFLEIMALRLGYDLGDFGSSVFLSEKEIRINSMCTVFAESEIVSLLARGEKPEDISKSLHTSVTARCMTMLNRVSAAGPLLMAGGGALNLGLVRLISDSYNGRVFVPDEPQQAGALGAALCLENSMMGYDL